MSDLDELIREKLPGQRFGIYHNVSEGTTLPDGTEDCSGFVVAEDGSHWFYWTGWQDGRVVFDEWQQEQPQYEWSDSQEYRAALAASRATAAGEGESVHE